MSSFMRFLQPLPSARRGYSSFFSSKPGGGRYFNSSKPAQKSVVTTNATKQTPSKGNAAAKGSVGEATEKVLQDIEGRATAGSSHSLPIASAPEDLPTSRTTSAPLPPCDKSSSSPNTGPTSEFSSFQPLQHHPMVDARDFRLHQFFSVHRPLLLLSDPAAILRSAPPGAPLFGEQPSKPSGQSEWRSSAAEAFDAIDADAETARQLNRALAMSQAGNAAAWEATLHRLGLDIDQQSDRVGLQEQLAQDWNDVMLDSQKDAVLMDRDEVLVNDVLLDSVRRKRKKKMKKHK